MEQDYLTLNERKQDYLSLEDYIKIFWRRKLLFLIPFFIILAASGAMALKLPPIYQSTAKILVESPQISDDLVRSAVTSYADDQIQVTKQRILTHKKLMQVIEKVDLYPEIRDSVTDSDLTDIIRANIEVSMIDVSSRRRRGASAIAFTVSFQHEDPSMAQKVTNELVTLFLEENVKNRIMRAAATTKFLDQEAKRLRAEVEVSEEQIAQYKQKNKDNLPEHLELYLERQESIKRDLQETVREIKSLGEQRNILEVQLAALKFGATSNNRDELNTPESLLKKLKMEQMELSMQYQPSHPDLIILEQKITDLRNSLDNASLVRVLEDERSQIEIRINNLTRKYTSNHPDIKVLESRLEEVKKQLASRPLNSQQPEKLDILNPATLEVQLKLKSIDSQMESLQKQEKELKERINKLEQSIVRVPHVERELKVLMRDYENLKMKYQDVKAKQMEAQLSENLETEKRAERFSLLEPPLLPEKPIKPNRPKILLMGLLLSFMGGFGTVFMVETTDKRIRNPNTLTKLMKQTPLVVIPYIENEQDYRNKWLRAIVFLAAITIIGVVGLAVLHYYYKPIDELWQLILERSGFLAEGN